MKKSSYIWLWLVAVLAILLLCQGCTFRYKDKDREFDAHVESGFEVETTDSNNGEDR